MTIEGKPSKEAFEKLDLGDIDAAVVLGDDICKELGICCTEKGKVMFQVFKKLRELKSKGTASAITAGDILDATASVFCPEGPGQTEITKKGGKEHA